jgi:hypothetical protein
MKEYKIFFILQPAMKTEATTLEMSLETVYEVYASLRLTGYFITRLNDKPLLVPFHAVTGITEV